jgi:CheY-like chemotaxis protein
MTERPKSSHEPSSAKEPTVFVVDDDASMRRALSNLFESVGLVVELFGSACEILHSKLPDVASCLVLDIRLRGLSGLDFQTELATANPLIRIILLPPAAKQAGSNLLGATCEIAIGLRSLVLPAGLALLAVAMGRPANIVGGRGS